MRLWPEANWVFRSDSWRRNSTNGPGKSQRSGRLATPTEWHWYTFIPGIHRVLLILHTKLFTHCLTPDPANMKKCPIQLGLLLYLSVQTSQITNVHETDTMTTQLHEGLLSGNRCIHLWCGHRTLARGRIKPKNSKTYALSSHLLLEHLHADWKKLQHLWTRVPRVLKALKHFRPHVTATEIPVTILTDHTNLTHWKATRKVNRWIARWFVEIQDYNLTIKHVPRKIHTASDMLSRPPGADQGKLDNADIILLPPSLFITTAKVQDNMLKEKVKEVQQKQKEEMELWCDTYRVHKLPEGYAKGWRLAVPSGLVLRWELMAQFHNSPTAGHPGRDNTLALVAQHYWWPGMTTWIERYIAGCALCQQNKIHTTKRKTPLYCIPGDLLMHLFNIVALDLITQLPKANSYNAILTIVDQGCSRAAIFLPCHMTITGEGVALLYLKHLFPWFRVPLKVISDQDPQFTSHFAQALTTKLSIGWNISTAFHPQTDGLTECKNQWVKQYICLYTLARQDDWEAWLPIVTFVHNQWPNATTKCSPHELLLGYCPSAAEEPTGITNNETVEERHRLIKEHREATLHALNETAQAMPISQYKMGEWVWLKAKYLALPYTSVKLALKHHGLFQIMKEISPVAYQLALPRAWMTHNVFHSSLLTPYKETHEHGA